MSFPSQPFLHSPSPNPSAPLSEHSDLESLKCSCAGADLEASGEIYF